MTDNSDTNKVDNTDKPTPSTPEASMADKQEASSKNQASDTTKPSGSNKKKSTVTAPDDNTVTATDMATTNTTDSTKNNAKNNTKNNAENTSAKPKATKASSTPPSSSSKRVVLLLTLVLILLMAVLAGGAYFAWQFWQEQEARVARIESGLQQKEQKDRDLSSQASSQTKDLGQQRKALAQLQQSLEQHQKAIEQRLNAQAVRLSQLSGENRDIWMLEEARYLLRLANQRKLTSGGVEGIIGLLQSADKLLLAIDRPDIFPLRESLSKDILRLKLAPVVDREGIYLALSALVNQTEALPSVPYVKETPKPAPSELPLAEDDKPAGIWSSIQQSLGQLDDYIRVKQHDEPLELWVSDVQQQLVAQNLRLMFEQAQTALLREEDAIYRESLEQAIFWLDKHYAHFEQKSALVDAIRELKKKIIVSQLPDISTSLIQLSQYIERAESTLSSPQVKAAATPKETSL